MSKDEEGAIAKSERVQMEEMLDEWRDVTDAAGQRAGTAQVTRQIKHEPDIYLDTVPYDDIRTAPQDYLRGRWGGGRFKVTLKDADKKFLKNATVYFSIEGDPVLQGVKTADTVEDEVARRVDLVLAQQKGNSGDQAVYVEMIRQSGEQVRAAIEAGASKEKADPMEIALGFMTAMQAANAPLMKAVLDRQQSGATEQIQMLTAMLELAQNMNSGDGGGVGSLVKTMAEPIAKLVDAHLATPTALPGQPQPETPVARPAWFPHLEPLLPALMGWAQGNKDPGLRAELVLDELRDEQIVPVFQALTADGFRSEFFQHVPGAAHHPDWFGTFFDAIIAGVDWSPEAAPEGADAGPGEPPDAELETTGGAVPTHAEG